LIAQRLDPSPLSWRARQIAYKRRSRKFSQAVASFLQPGDLHGVIFAVVESRRKQAPAKEKKIATDG
jgi:hypothetical protein